MDLKVKRIKGPTIKLFGGTYFDFEDPESSEFTIEDIAHALSNLCRFNGHTHAFYSVAQHSVMVSRIVPPEDAYAGLMHDAAEAFVGDIAKPLKVMLPDYKIIEDRVEASVFARFGVPRILPPSVKRADLIMLRTEQRDLMEADSDTWTPTEGIEPHPQSIIPISPMGAKRDFLARFRELCFERDAQ